MINETMTNDERMAAAIALEPVDRAPVFPILVTSAPRLYGITQAEAWANHDVAREALIRCFEDYGYDSGSKPNYYYPMTPGKLTAAPVRNLIPGKQLGPDDLYQVDERVLFEREDYDAIAALGWNEFWVQHYPKISRKNWEQFTWMQQMSNELYVADTRICEERGMPIFLGCAVDSVLMSFSLCRTLNEFTKDLYEVPDKVQKAMDATCDHMIANAIEICRNNNKNVAFIVLERGSGFYYRMPIFERFEWPYLQRYVDAFVSEGILPWLHFDTDWILNLPYLKQLPRGKCVCDLDGTTDIFKAKEILKGHMCISGDVPASLLTLGQPADVEAYCRKLIDEVGDGGGFMLTTGCECPIDVKPENLRAMVDTGRSYVGKKGRTKSAAEISPQATAQAPAVEGKLARAVAELQFDDAVAQVDSAIAAGADPLAILGECRIGMDRVGELYSTGEYFLSELMMSANLFKTVADKLAPLLAQSPKEASLGALVIATPKGDIHDIGKNIVATLLKIAGFDVHDLGVDVPVEKIVDTVARTDARVIAMSALITPTFESMKQVVDQLTARGLREGRFVIIGGGVVTGMVCDYVGADAWTGDPKKGINLCRAYVAGDGN